MVPSVQRSCSSRMHETADPVTSDDIILCSALFCFLPDPSPKLPPVSYSLLLPPSLSHFSVSTDLVSVSFLWFLGN